MSNAIGKREFTHELPMKRTLEPLPTRHHSAAVLTTTTFKKNQLM